MSSNYNSDGGPPSAPAPGPAPKSLSGVVQPPASASIHLSRPIINSNNPTTTNSAVSGQGFQIPAMLNPASWMQSLGSSFGSFSAQNEAAGLTNLPPSPRQSSTTSYGALPNGPNSLKKASLTSFGGSLSSAGMTTSNDYSTTPGGGAAGSDNNGSSTIDVTTFTGGSATGTSAGGATYGGSMQQSLDDSENTSMMFSL